MKSLLILKDEHFYISGALKSMCLLTPEPARVAFPLIQQLRPNEYDSLLLLVNGGIW